MRCSQNRFLQRALKSGKYKEYVVKFDYAVGLASGMPVDYAGLHIGTRHDSRTFKENLALRAAIFDWEFWLGDKAYIGIPEFLTEFKGSNLCVEKIEWNLMLQHYRGRNEHLIAEMKQPRAAINTRWRGSYSLLNAITKIVAHMVGLQERMKGPRYDCYGSWEFY